MTFMKKLTRRCYIGTNLILAALFANVLLFGGYLDMGSAFTAGLATGLGVGWLIYALVGWLELRRPGRSYDERSAAIATKAASVSFALLVLALAIGAALLRSQTLELKLSAAELCGLLLNGAMASYGISAFALSKKM
ncbi:MAG TPA: hypothetical protein DCG47_13490 [Spirochaetaceae bacterium]|jgi:multisubunit Na+/H+ antiporter MnhB subunit|nr:hypothetical protein [Spirochaetaceae bacterium]